MRKKESGLFSASPFMPPSIEDTYHAISILKLLLSESDLHIMVFKKNNLLIKKLEEIKIEGLRTYKKAYQYLYICKEAGLNMDLKWIENLIQTSERGSLELMEQYYKVKIIRKFLGKFLTLPNIDIKRFRTSQELFMLLYLMGMDEKKILDKSYLITWVQKCQNPDGGFGPVHGSTSFMDSTYWGLKALSILNSTPVNINSSYEFIMGCMTASGGFARKNGSAPFLDSTWYGISCLNIIQGMKNNVQYFDNLSF